MKQLYFTLLLCFLLLTRFTALAQNVYILSGKVTDEGQKPLSGATVFVDGSQIATVTDNNGRYTMSVPGLGAYHLSANLLGYTPASNDILLKDRSANSDFTLKVKSVLLDEVKIGIDRNWDKDFALFRAEFLGPSPNAAVCKIINPEVMSFHIEKGVMTGNANDLLIIENPKLGYRLKYLLKEFKVTKTYTIKNVLTKTSYEGDVVFEELPGTEAQKKQWAGNRLNVYKGSILQFFRSVFANKVLQTGFIVSEATPESGARSDVTEPINLESLITTRNASFVTFKAPGINIVYDTRQAAKLLAQKAVTYLPDTTDRTRYVTNLMPDEKEILITVDAKGQVPKGYWLSFDAMGDWSHHRVADQLPFEYQPPNKTFIEK